MALEIARERKALEFDRNGKPKKKQAGGLDVDKVLGSIIEENINVSGGYRKASVKDTLLYQLLICPYTLFFAAIWWSRWAHKYWVRKEEYDREAKLYLIRKNLGVGEEQFNVSAPGGVPLVSQGFEESLIDEYLSNNLWVKADFERWKALKEQEEKEKLAGSARYRQYRRYMKKMEGQTISFLDD